MIYSYSWLSNDVVHKVLIYKFGRLVQGLDYDKIEDIEVELEALFDNNRKVDWDFIAWWKYPFLRLLELEGMTYDEVEKFWEMIGDIQVAIECKREGLN